VSGLWVPWPRSKKKVPVTLSFLSFPRYFCFHLHCLLSFAFNHPILFLSSSFCSSLTLSLSLPPSSFLFPQSPFLCLFYRADESGLSKHPAVECPVWITSLLTHTHKPLTHASM